MGNDQNPKLKTALLIPGEDSTAEKSFYLAAEKGEMERAENFRSQFVKRLATEFLGDNIPFSNHEFLKTYRQIKSHDENENKKKEDMAILKTKKYLGDKMGEVGRLAGLGAQNISRSEVSSALSKTAVFAGRFTLVGITFGYLVKEIFDDEGTKLKKYTEKMVNNLRKELETKVFHQEMDSFFATLYSIQKLFSSLVNVMSYDETSGITKSGDQESQIMAGMLQQCDVVFEKIKQKKLFFKYSYYFLDSYYNFALFHCALVKSAIDDFKLTIYNTHIREYISQYKSMFKEYIEEAKNMRTQCYVITYSESSFNIITKTLANQQKVYEYLVDEMTGECLITTEISHYIEPVVTENVISSISRIYHKVRDLKPRFFDLKLIQTKLREEVYSIFTERFTEFELSLNDLLSEIIGK